MPKFLTSPITLFPVFIALILIPSGAQTSSKYPLRVSVLTTQWTTSPSSTLKQGRGKGDIQEGQKVTGFDFTYECGVPFLATGFEKPYSGKWIEKGSRLVLLVTQLDDTDKRSDCELKIAPSPQLYAEKGGRLVTVDLAEFRELEERREAAERAELGRKNAKYPLKVSLLEAHWTQGGMMRMGIGRGNATDGKTTVGFEFKAKCPLNALVSLESADYRGRWEENKTRLTIAPKPAGDSETISCELETIVKPYTFKRAADGTLTTVPAAIKPLKTPKSKP